MTVQWRLAGLGWDAAGMKPKISLQTRLAYDDVAKGLADAGVVEGSMFGMPCLKIEKKMLAGLYGDAMTFKLPPEPREEAPFDASPSVLLQVVGPLIRFHQRTERPR